ncbi:MAG: hypothetical protein M3R69_05685, partial [Acidobacteriota bacterium]|nr:hypothetical protein [Acidobacteriota bacterium]
CFALQGHTDRVRAVAIVNDQLLSGGADKTLRAWDIEVGKLLSTEQLSHEVRGLQTTPNGERFVINSGDTVTVVDSKSGDELGILQLPSPVAITPDGRRLIAFRSIGGTHGQIEIWDIESKQMIHAVDAHPAKRGFYPTLRAIAVSPDGKYIISGGADRVINIWDAESFSLISILEGHTEEVWALAFFPDCHRIASGSWDQMIKVWQIEAT